LGTDVCAVRTRASTPAGFNLLRPRDDGEAHAGLGRRRRQQHVGHTRQVLHAERRGRHRIGVARGLGLVAGIANAARRRETQIVSETGV
jgi:hypothetical protein